MSYYGFKPYVPVAERRAKAERTIKKLRKKETLYPIELATRTISHTFWGKAWCHHIESFTDYENRLPRGRTYVRHGLVCHLIISSGKVEAMVYGSSMYHIKITVQPCAQKKWNALKQRCLGKISSVLELLTGQLSKEVMEIVCDHEQGLFPTANEIHLSCDCPDWATMCKHVAAVLYGVAVRLDESPEHIFLLRGVDHHELIDPAALIAQTTQATANKERRIDLTQAGDIFGIALPQDDSRQKKPKKANTTVFPKRLTGLHVYKKRCEFQCSQQQFAQMIGVSASTIFRWESSGRKNLTIQDATKAKLTAVWQSTVR